MDKLNEFRQLVADLSDCFGIFYGVGEAEGCFPLKGEEDDAWFICPECGEPNYFNDWGSGHEGICHCCEISYDELFND